MTSPVGVPSGGNNPRYGRDDRGAPTVNLNAGVYGGAGIGYATYGYPYPYLSATAFPYTYYTPGTGHLPSPPQTRPSQGYAYVSGFGGGTQQPQPPPAAVDEAIPAANMTNSTGGVGCEPGYNYFFAAEHTKVHVLKSGPTPPWQLPANTTVPFHACHIPVSTTVADLLTGFGATNPVAKLNRATEVVQGGNGRWYKGITLSGDNSAQLKTTLKELGWDRTRSGLPGERPVVYLYVTKG